MGSVASTRKSATSLTSKKSASSENPLPSDSTRIYVPEDATLNADRATEKGVSQQSNRFWDLTRPNTYQPNSTTKFQLDHDFIVQFLLKLLINAEVTDHGIRSGHIGIRAEVRVVSQLIRIRNGMIEEYHGTCMIRHTRSMEAEKHSKLNLILF